MPAPARCRNRVGYTPIARMLLAFLMIEPLTVDPALAQQPSAVALVARDWRRQTAAAGSRGGTIAIPTPIVAALAPDAPSGSKPAPWWAPTASLVLPGAGQATLRQARGVAYVAAETFLWLQIAASRTDLNKEEGRFRALAADVARKRFGGALPSGSWEYYESMEKFLESGLFDRIPGGAVDPETDTLTYNGARWLLARQNNWRDPAVAPALGSVEYQRALAAYQSEAITDAYRWSWRDAQLQQDVFKQTIARRNKAFQRGTSLLGLVYANHLFSMIDAYIGVRVRRFGGAGVAGLRFDGISTTLDPLGDPANGAVRVTSRIRLSQRRR